MESVIKNKYLLLLKKDALKRSFRIKEVYVHIIVWICLLSIPITISTIEYGELRSNFLYRFMVNPLLLYSNYLILVPFLLLKKKISTYILVSLALLLLLNLLMRYVLPVDPIEEFERFVRRARMPKYRRFPHMVTAIISLAFFLLGGVLGLTKDFYKRDKASKEKESKQKETELQFLRAQLNPHFLFNSLNSIYSLVRNKSNDASEAVITLSELMRYMLYEAKQEFVPLIKEIDYIKNFVALQRLRLSDSENVNLKISGDYNNKIVPPLLLIPFVENAFKYGTDFKGRTDIDMRIEIADDQLDFHVRNKVGPYKKDLENSGIGLENIKNRLMLLFPESHNLTIDRQNGNYGVRLQLTLS